MQTQIESSGIDYSEVVKCFLRDLEAIPPISKTGLTPLGLPLTDYLIGGGLRPGEVSLIAGLEREIGELYRLQKTLVAVKNTRSIRKKDLIHNTYQPTIEVDPQTYEVRTDGELLTCEPAEVLPLAQLYHLF